MEALNDLVRLGKVRYIGASSMFTWQFAKAQAIAEKRGWAKFVSMQNFYNLAYREEEREMNPYCKDSNVALIPWSPLARGTLTHSSQTTRAQTDWFRTMTLPPLVQEANNQIAAAVETIATKHNATKAQICLAWLFAKGVTSPILGISKIEYIDDLAGSWKVKLGDEDIKILEDGYVPRQIWGHS
ncbi:hypothetical protein HK097_005717 [Rhizophlyctis rosea]|uniref:NADP-dependent oxidoreductase domain-containing protein n=1 Tax=Rhizophlyctis rosea TaxID=64517 RepID=A0AAD5SET2_9FUNG|nr:hypothetical protein HK097_005717 [Rhizophlyctis rosea]